MRDGADVRLPKGQHRFVEVYAEMFRQVCYDYSGLPDPRTLTIAEIRFFYDGIRDSLRKATRGG